MYTGLGDDTVCGVELEPPKPTMPKTAPQRNVTIPMTRKTIEIGDALRLGTGGMTDASV